MNRLAGALLVMTGTLVLFGLTVAPIRRAPEVVQYLAWGNLLAGAYFLTRDGLPKPPGSGQGS